jgi:hypothetical protein
MEGDRPRKHRYSANMIQKSIELFNKCLAYKQIGSVFKVLFSNIPQKKPSDSTIRLWIMRSGYAKLNKTLPEGQWMMIR